MGNIIFKYRGELLMVIAIIDIFFSIFMVAENFIDGNVYWLIGIAVNITVISFAIYLYYKLNDYEFMDKREQFLHSYSQYCYVFFDYKSGNLSLGSNARKILNFTKDKSYSLEDIKYIFDESDWNEINKLISNKEDLKSLDKVGTATIQNKNFASLYLRYHAHYISSLNYKMDGIIFWFGDFTESVKSQIELVALIKHYRLVSFELDVLLNNLPFPIWRREADNSIVFHNTSFTGLQKGIAGKNAKNDGFSSIVESIGKKVQLSGSTVKDKKPLFINNSYEVFEFCEIPLGPFTGSIGYALSGRDRDEVEKSYQSLLSILNNIIDNCNTALLVIDNRKNIVHFNQKYTELFGLDSAWLSTQPQYIELLDKLRELKKIPEVKDFRDYKELQLQSLRELLNPQTKLLHLTNGKTIKCAMIPSKGGNTIFMYDDITEVVNNESLYNELQSVHFATLNHINLPIINFSLNGRVSYYNRSFLELFGLSEEYISTLPHFKDIFANSNLNEAERSLFKSKIISVLESRVNNSAMYRDHIISLKTLPDSSVLLIFTKS